MFLWNLALQGSTYYLISVTWNAEKKKINALVYKGGVKGDPDSDIGPFGQNLGQKPCYPPDLRNKNGKGPSEHP